MSRPLGLLVVFLLSAELFKAEGVELFAAGKEAEQVAVGERAQRFGAVAVAVQAVVGEDAWPVQAVLPQPYVAGTLLARQEVMRIRGLVRGFDQLLFSK